MKRLFSLASALLLSALSFLAPSSANAAPAAAIDVADVTGTMTNQLTSITGVGLAILVLAAIVTGIAFVRKAASGR